MPLLRFHLNDNLYIRDPQETEYGQRLLKHSISLMVELGFENFTFKKLASDMNSVEASVYRYFENKHKLLLFLTNWYWEYVHYCIKIQEMGELSPKKRLENAIENLVECKITSSHPDALNTKQLRKLVIEESTKAYHVNDVDKENELGLFAGYKQISKKLSEIIQSVNPAFVYPKSLASTIIELINHQLFVVEHLPSLTDIEDPEQANEEIFKFIHSLCSKLLDLE